MAGYLRRHGAVYVAPTGPLGPDAEETYAQRVMLDRYAVRASCGVHEIKEVFLDGYHRGAWLPPGIPGWTIGKREVADESRLAASEGTKPDPSSPSTLDGAWNLSFDGAGMGDNTYTVQLKDGKIRGFWGSLFEPGEFGAPAHAAYTADGLRLFLSDLEGTGHSHDFRGRMDADGAVHGEVTIERRGAGGSGRFTRAFRMAKIRSLPLSPGASTQADRSTAADRRLHDGERQAPIQDQPRHRAECPACGRPLGWFNRVLGRARHRHCGRLPVK